MSSIVQSAQPIIIPDPSDPTYGPSGGNTAKYTTTAASWSFSTGAITAGNSSAALYTFNVSNYSNPAYLYRITFNFELSPLTFATTPAGNLSVIIQNAGANIGQVNTYCRANVVNLVPYQNGCITGVFRGSSSASLQVFISNDTTANLTSGTLRVTNACIETITTSFTNVSNFT